MTVYYTDHTRPDNSGNGLSPGAAKKTIVAGLAAMTSAGDHLEILAGTYDEFIDTENGGYNIINGGGSWATATVIKNYQSDVVWMLPTTNPHPNTGVILLNNRNWIIFDGIRLDGVNRSTLTSTLKINAGSHHVRYTNGEIKNSGNCVLTADYDQDTGFIEILNSELHEATGYGVYSGESDGLYDNLNIHAIDGYGFHFYRETSEFAPTPRDCSRNLVRNCYVHDYNRVVGPRAGLLFYRGDDNVAYNNIIVNNPSSISSVIQTTGQLRMLLYNNTLHNADNLGFGVTFNDSQEWPGPTIFHTADCEVRNCIIYQCAAGDIVDNGAATGTVLAANVTADPHFVDAAGGDYHINDITSPCCDTGNNLSGTLTTDFDGNARPPASPGDAWDVGAFEFEGEAPPPPSGKHLPLRPA